MGPPLRRIKRRSCSSRRGRTLAGPQIYAARPGGRALQPSTSYHLLNRARRRYEIAVAIIFANPGPSGPEETAESHSDFARRKYFSIFQVRVPRKWGPGVSRHWRTKFASAASPGDPQGELPRRGKRRWPGPLGTFPSLGKYLAPQGETLLQQTKGLYHCPLIRPLRGHLSLSPLSLRDISP